MPSRIIPFCLAVVSVLTTAAPSAQETPKVEMMRVISLEEFLAENPVLPRGFSLGNLKAEEPDCDANTLCLLGGQFKAQVIWYTATGSGVGTVVPIPSSVLDGGGLLWFFDRNNPELFLKLVDACANPSHRVWAFVAATTNVRLSLVIVFVPTGVGRVYINPPNTLFRTVGDTDGFDVCASLQH